MRELRTPLRAMVVMAQPVNDSSTTQSRAMGAAKRVDSNYVEDRYARERALAIPT